MTKTMEADPNAYLRFMTGHKGWKAGRASDPTRSVFATSRRLTV
jgi:hypothetical protein